MKHKESYIQQAKKVIEQAREIEILERISGVKIDYYAISLNPHIFIVRAHKIIIVSIEDLQKDVKFFKASLKETKAELLSDKCNQLFDQILIHIQHRVCSEVMPQIEPNEKGFSKFDGPLSTTFKYFWKTICGVTDLYEFLSLVTIDTVEQVKSKSQFMVNAYHLRCLKTAGS